MLTTGVCQAWHSGEWGLGGQFNWSITPKNTSNTIRVEFYHNNIKVHQTGDVTKYWPSGSENVFYDFQGKGPGEVYYKVAYNSGQGINNSAKLLMPYIAPAMADFIYTKKYGEVEFANISTGPIAGCFWEFGDGATSAEVNPTHRYETTGTYTAKLTVTNGRTSSIKTYQISIEVFKQPHIIYSDTEILGQLSIRHTNKVDMHDVAPELEAWLIQFTGLSNSTIQQSIDAAVTAMIDGNPVTIDTLKEISAYMTSEDNSVTMNIISQILAAKAELKGTVSTELDTMQEIIERIGFTAESGGQYLNAASGPSTLATELTLVQRQSVGRALLSIIVLINAETSRAQAAELALQASVAAEIASQNSQGKEIALAANIQTNAVALAALLTTVGDNLTGGINALIDNASVDFNTLGKIEIQINTDRTRLNALEIAYTALQADIDQFEIDAATMVANRRATLVNASFATEIELAPGGVMIPMPIEIAIDRGWDISKVRTECTMLMVDGTEVHMRNPVQLDYVMRDAKQVILFRTSVAAGSAPTGAKLRIIAMNIELIQ